LTALYQSLLTRNDALKSLQREYKKLLDRDQQLSLVLSTLRTGYNPNYQDMAVLEAVRGWEEIAGLPHINDVGKVKEGESEGNTPKEEATNTEAEAESGAWTKERLDTELESLLNADHASLLFAHDDHTSEPLEGFSCELNSFIFLLFLDYSFAHQCSNSTTTFQTPLFPCMTDSRRHSHSGW
jgi:protein kinase C substrate 80K-H